MYRTPRNNLSALVSLIRVVVFIFSPPFYSRLELLKRLAMLFTEISKMELITELKVRLQMQNYIEHPTIPADTRMLQ